SSRWPRRDRGGIGSAAPSPRSSVQGSRSSRPCCVHALWPKSAIGASRTSAPPPRRCRRCFPRSSARRTAPRSSISPGTSPTAPPRPALPAELPGVAADVFLVELKAATVDVVAEYALSRRAAVVLAANDPVPLPGELDLDETLLQLARIRV